jgi:hypothetical protein
VATRHAPLATRATGSPGKLMLVMCVPPASKMCIAAASVATATKEVPTARDRGSSVGSRLRSQPPREDSASYGSNLTDAELLRVKEVQSASPEKETPPSALFQAIAALH